ncbi:MAG: DUF3298 domain-containing protein [Peptostreptococcaceae bacterium]|nr:DUF3298 domain-containing protein [Peptostreptococcaceae bacterium]
MQEFDEMKKNYEEIEIPAELEFLVRKTIRDQERKMKTRSGVRRSMLSFAAALLLFTGTVNISPAAAQTFSEIPGMRNLVHLVLVKNWARSEPNFAADIKAPGVRGLGDPELEDSLNKKYLEEGAALYREFERQIGEMKKSGSGYLALFSDYEVIAETQDLLTIRRTYTSVKASGFERADFDTIDKKKKIVLTLPALFKDESYIRLISENIKEQMRKRMESDQSAAYFFDAEEASSEKFESIKKNQSFYINTEGALVIVFDEYEVAPGSMGLVEFVIPTPVIREALAGEEYIR